MSVAMQDNRVLAVYPTSRGFGYVLFEGPESPYDWGVRDIKDEDKNGKTLAEIAQLIERYHPETLVLEGIEDRRYRRNQRIRRLYRMLVHLAETEYVEVYRYSDEALQRYFVALGARTKYERAKAIARQIPAFAHRMPRVRKPWMAADPRQALFDAAALGLVHYAARGVPSPYGKD